MAAAAWLVPAVLGAGGIATQAIVGSKQSNKALNTQTQYNNELLAWQKQQAEQQRQDAIAAAQAAWNAGLPRRAAQLQRMQARGINLTPAQIQAALTMPAGWAPAPGSATATTPTSKAGYGSLGTISGIGGVPETPKLSTPAADPTGAAQAITLGFLGGLTPNSYTSPTNPNGYVGGISRVAPTGLAYPNYGDQ